MRYTISFYKEKNKEMRITIENEVPYGMNSVTVKLKKIKGGKWESFISIFDRRQMHKMISLDEIDTVKAYATNYYDVNLEDKFEENLATRFIGIKDCITEIYEI